MKTQFILGSLFVTLGAFAQMHSVNRVSPNQITESCFYPETVLNFSIDAKQKKNLAKLCSIDAYSNSSDPDIKNALMCPKLTSSSPGIYLIENENRLSTADFKEKICATRRPQKLVDGEEYKKLAKFKTSLGYTKAHSSVIYNYLSKMIFQNLTVPEAVFRTFDYAEQKKEVAFALNQIQKLQIPKTQIIVDSWVWLSQLYKSQKPPTDLKYNDQTILGILIKDIKAIQYVEMAAGPATDSKLEKNMSYQKVFSEKNIIQDYSKIQRTEIQSLIESQGLADMLIIDTLLSQRDRYGSYGNIHYVPEWLKIENNEFIYEKATLDESEKRVNSAEINLKQSQGFLLVKKIALLDNDGAIKNANENSNKKRNVVTRLNHLSQRTYTNLMNLNEQLKNAVNIEKVENAFLLKDSEMATIVANLSEITRTLKNNCKSGFLKLDLNTADITNQKMNGNICE